MIRLVVFLGNPGKEYERTRHNAGWMVCSALEGLDPVESWNKKFHGRWTAFSPAGTQPIRLLQPLTYMNESGQSVEAALHFFSLKPEELLVVHDDLELAFGTLCLQKGGGLQGHNGLRSIAQHISSDAFGRFRFGIGRPKQGSVSSFVTSRFSPEEEISLPLVLQKSRDLLLSACSQGLPPHPLRITLP